MYYGVTHNLKGFQRNHLQNYKSEVYTLVNNILLPAAGISMQFNTIVVIGMDKYEPYELTFPLRISISKVKTCLKTLF